ncbi:MAG: hypothetical protein WC756_04625 [Taibaiella sp.]|jgi:hypothetical protein
MKSLTGLIICILFYLPAVAQLPAFKGAEGFGATATGGRGKEVYHVTNLKDNGAGSFRDAVSKAGRTVVFDIGGVIKLDSRVNVMSDITIAGQTAPGPGITLYGESVAFNKIKNVIVRYIRMHGSINMKRGSCVLIADSSDNIIFDHISVTWGRWDDLHIKGSTNITLQYCLVGESLDPQRFGALLERPEYLSIHHCLWISNQSRNPKAKAKIEYINNVIYNWGNSGFVGGHSSADHYQDIVNNYFISGPSSSESFLSMFTETDHVYHSGNYVDLNKDGSLNGKLVTDADFSTDKVKASLVTKKQNISIIPVTVESAAKAYESIIASAGCSIERDPVDERLIKQLFGLGKEGEIIWTETQVGGQPKIEPKPTTLSDSDQDGIPDAWEQSHGLDEHKASDAIQIRKNGYTSLEDYFENLLKK